MSSRRFYHPDLAASSVELPPDEAQHARKVLRLCVGDTVQLFDGAGSLATGRISRCDKRVEIDIVERRRAARLVPHIDLAVCIPKGDRAAFLVEKLSELGADRVIPLLATRSVVEPGEGKIERFARVALESCKQCGRPWVMQVAEPVTFEKLIASADHPHRYIADVPPPPTPDTPESAAAGVQHFPASIAGMDRVLVLVGPEGGWTDDERNAANSRGFVPVRCSPNVLRIETAALAAVAILRQQA